MGYLKVFTIHIAYKAQHGIRVPLAAGANLRSSRPLINAIAERQPRLRSRWWHRSRLLQSTRLMRAGAPRKRTDASTAKSSDTHRDSDRHLLVSIASPWPNPFNFSMKRDREARTRADARACASPNVEEFATLVVREARPSGREGLVLEAEEKCPTKRTKQLSTVSIDECDSSD